MTGRRVLTDDDREAIVTLALEGLRAPAIAKRLNSNRSTVYWYMLTAGLCAPGPADLEQRTYVRKGRTVYRFTLSEDNYIERRRAEGLSMRQIAKLASAVYKTHRTPHAIAIRLTMLAAREDAA